MSLYLSIAGVVFQNVGYRLLKDAIGPYGHLDFLPAGHQIGSGTVSPIWEEYGPAIQETPVVLTIKTVFWLVLTAGAICTVASLVSS